MLTQYTWDLSLPVELQMIFSVNLIHSEIPLIECNNGRAPLVFKLFSPFFSAGYTQFSSCHLIRCVMGFHYVQFLINTLGSMSCRFSCEPISPPSEIF